jgi:hypothetical protein
MNRLVLWTYDQRSFAVFVRLAYRLSIAVVRELLPPVPVDAERQLTLQRNVDRAVGIVKVSASARCCNTK